MVGWTLDLDIYSTSFFPDRRRESLRRLWEQTRVYTPSYSARPPKRKSRVKVSPTWAPSQGKGIVVFPFRLFHLLSCVFIQRWSDLLRMPSLPQSLDHCAQSATLQRCWRMASNNTIATAVARFRLRVPCIGIVMQLSVLAASKASGSPFVSRPNTRKSSFSNFTS